MAATASDARACGGCFHGPTQNGDVITDHRMIFSVSPQQTTLYDEIEYQGNPASFAWVPLDARASNAMQTRIRAAGFPSLYLITPLNRFDVIRGVLAGGE